jgi:hypothetical protein
MPHEPTQNLRDVRRNLSDCCILLTSTFKVLTVEVDPAWGNPGYAYKSF